MHGRKSGFLIFFITALGFTAIGLLVGLNLPNVPDAHSTEVGHPQISAPAPVPALPEPAADHKELVAQAIGLPSFSSLVRKASPAVVNIQFEKSMQVRRGPFGGGGGGGGDPFGDFFERFFGQQMPREYKNKGLGTGFVITSDGLIVTNNHVVEQADKIVVKFQDEDKEYPAKVVGRDAKTDIAIIKVEAGKKLATLPMGDSDKAEVGDWVIAIGNPLGLSHTVTKGIISFKGRKDVHPGGSSGYSDFIQTDAPINPGNSGGPLINLNGEVIGVNESMVGGAQNIGFAVPINMVKAVLPGLREHGKVTRAWMGVQIQPITQELADSFGMGKPEGALIADVVPGGPADKAGLRTGDVVVEFNGRKIGKAGELPWLASNAGIGAEAVVKVLRDGAQKDVRVRMGELPDGAGKGGRDGTPGAQGKGEELGLMVKPIPPEVAQELNLKPGKGVMVVDINEDSSAARAGVEREDIIIKINSQETNSVVDFVKVAKSIKAGGLVRMLVKRGEGSLFLAFKK
ncbi:MAG: Do family serine endopeptidase [Myxococcota bacterium]